MGVLVKKTFEVVDRIRLTLTAVAVPFLFFLRVSKMGRSLRPRFERLTPLFIITG